MAKWYNPFSWQDGYRSQRDARIQAEGNAARDYLEDVGNLDDLPEDAQRMVRKFINGEIDDLEMVYAAIRYARNGEYLEKKYRKMLENE